MGDKSHIGWTDATWNPLLGCDKVSEGCTHCYAILTANRLASNPNAKVAAAYRGLVRREPSGALEWTGQVNLLPERLQVPLRWARPRRIFVNSQADLFHKDVPDLFIAQVLAVMALTPQHIYQVLTKRPGRMRSLVSDECRCGAGHAPGVHLRSRMAWAVSKANPARLPGVPDDAEQRVWAAQWPLPNLWPGTSVEDQHWARIRIPQLVATPGAVHWLSCEPLLAPLDVSTWLHLDEAEDGYPPVRWVVVGGESGKDARRMELGWAGDLYDQCRAARTPFFFKQTGSVLAAELGLPGKGDDPALWPFEWVQQYPRELAVSGA